MKEEIREKELCYVAVMNKHNSNWTAGVVKEGEKGYYLTDWDWDTTRERAEQYVKDLNDKMGISEKQSIMMVARSMFN